MQITICGGGNAAHAAAGLFAAQKDHQVHVYLSIPDEAERWREGISARGGIFVTSKKGNLMGRPKRISSNPAEVIPGSSLVLLSLPAFAHESVLREIVTYLDDGVFLGVLAARGCFDLCVRDVLDQKFEKVILFGLQSLPWACRITHYGQEVAILGTKAYVDMAVSPPERADELAPFLGDQLGLQLERIGNFLSLTLAGTGQIIHPGVMYGMFYNWDGTYFKEPPLFYQGIDDGTANVLQSLSDEIQTLRGELEDRFPRMDLFAVRPLDEWLCRSYADDIEDTSSLQTYFVTNRSYAGLKVPMQSIRDKFVPDFQARYLSEDVPYGLLATRGVAELANVATPTMDKVISWAQERLGKEYLVDGSICGRDLDGSRAPQRYGFLNLGSMINAMY